MVSFRIPEHRNPDPCHLPTIIFENKNRTKDNEEKERHTSAVKLLYLAKSRDD
jgi:hypothetical protein